MTTVRLRSEQPADGAGIRRVLGDAFGRPDAATPAEVRLVEALRGSTAWLPELSMVAEAAGEIVGYALLSRVTVEPSGTPALALGPVAVRPDRQGLGYGTDVVEAVLDAATELGESLVVVLGSPAYYRRFGFQPAVRLGLTSPWSGLGSPWQALVLPTDTGDAPAPPPGEVSFPAPWSLV
ncbi:GNAT family N-acetyltransferase [Plantactinospora sp. GCM10030261]|uniref:GNAT family N-acetyltransferase n=1 Tax=Plantactinospora sp. GCM10030261 TaxID=3273420 RepID=UPI00361BE296